MASTKASSWLVCLLIGCCAVEHSLSASLHLLSAARGNAPAIWATTTWAHGAPSAAHRLVKRATPKQKQIVTKERYALLAFKQSLSGSDAAKLASWATGTDHCDGSWLGIGCLSTRPRRVYMLDLSEQGLVFPLAALNFTAFPALQVLWLHGNSILDSLDTFSARPFKFGALLELRLNDAGLVGTIPAALPNKLKRLHLQNNQLTGTLPPELATATPQLEVVMLAANNLQGSVPESWSALAKLKQLSLESNVNLAGCLPAWAQAALTPPLRPTAQQLETAGGSVWSTGICGVCGSVQCSQNNRTTPVAIGASPDISTIPAAHPAAQQPQSAAPSAPLPAAEPTVQAAALPAAQSTHLPAVEPAAQSTPLPATQSAALPAAEPASQALGLPAPPSSTLPAAEASIQTPVLPAAQPGTQAAAPAATVTAAQPIIQAAAGPANGATVPGSNPVPASPPAAQLTTPATGLPASPPAAQATPVSAAQSPAQQNSAADALLNALRAALAAPAAATTAAPAQVLPNGVAAEKPLGSGASMITPSTPQPQAAIAAVPDTTAAPTALAVQPAGVAPAPTAAVQPQTAMPTAVAATAAAASAPSATSAAPPAGLSSGNSAATAVVTPLAAAAAPAPAPPSAPTAMPAAAAPPANTLSFGQGASALASPIDPALTVIDGKNHKPVYI